MHLKAALANVSDVSTIERSVCAKSHGVLARPPPRMDRHLGGKRPVGRDVVDSGDAAVE